MLKDAKGLVFLCSFMTFIVDYARWLLMFQRFNQITIDLNITVHHHSPTSLQRLSNVSRSRRTPPSPPSGKRFWWRWLCPRRVPRVPRMFRAMLFTVLDAREYVENMWRIWGALRIWFHWLQEDWNTFCNWFNQLFLHFENNHSTAGDGFWPPYSIW